MRPVISIPRRGHAVKLIRSTYRAIGLLVPPARKRLLSQSVLVSAVIPTSSDDSTVLAVKQLVNIHAGNVAKAVANLGG